MKRPWCLIVIVVLACGCGFGSGDFSLTGATVDPDHACPSGVTNAPYDIHVTITSHNGRSSAVSIKGASAVMTLAAIHGGWLQPVGYQYESQNVAYSPDHVGAGSDATLQVTVPSACTNQSANGGLLSYADYSIVVTLATSAGAFKVSTRNRHRIIAS